MLSKLNANPEELVQFEHDLKNIFNMFDHLKLVNTNGISLMISPLLSHYPARDDVSQAQNHAAAFERIAPEFANQHFIVPKVIE